MTALKQTGTGARSAHQGLEERLVCLHDEIKGGLPGINRVAVAVYDRHTDLLKAFVHSSEATNPFEHTVARLADLKSLSELAAEGGERVIDDLATHPAGTPAHARRMVQGGYRSSYTLPIYDKGAFHGFVFFNSFQPGYFTHDVVRRLRPIAEVVALHAVMEMDAVRMIQSAVRMVRTISRARDDETAQHLERMSRYARLIAQRLAPRRGMSDEFVEFLFQFAPMHDIGKIGVPDSILMKQGRLDPLEFEVMKGHVRKGVETIDVIADTFRLGGAPYVRILRNAVAEHHEAIDGSGYPRGLAGDQISLEGRIVAVADVFDALTSERPYKQAWSNEDAIRYLVEQAGRKLDADCVDILRNSPLAILDIQRQFADEAP